MADIADTTAQGPENTEQKPIKVKWYRSVFYNATILGLCSFAAPGLWGAMNSLGAGGSQSPYLVNTGNALTFCLMVVSCWLTSSAVKYIGITGALFIGTIGYAPYSAGLYLNNRYGVEWLVIVGAAFCGISAGIFWAAEAAIAISYPEPRNRARMVAYWLTWTRIGQILGGAVNLGLNIDRNQAGKVSYTVYIIFIALQASGTLIALLLNKPSKVQRRDGTPVQLVIYDNPWQEIKTTTSTFLTKKFLLLVLWIGQGVYSESVFFTYNALWFSVRARALGSFLSGIVAVICGNLLGLWLDQHQISLKTRSRRAFAVIMTLQGAWWLWLTINVTEYNRTQPIFDWNDPGFGRAFGVFVFLVSGFQLNYNFSYFIISQISSSPQETIRLSALLRGTESAWQAVSYGLNAVPIIAAVGGPYINFGLWGVSIIPAWLVIRDFGTEGDKSDLESHLEIQAEDLRKDEGSN
ncbi:major facilitator superfamily domain-containing protein [Daldinia decipiens]|uniref:major facilitator superfamily domain-containing protein n=1 Tax=Daldinia decipiens TaxID=326647 RepID=UPI0020C4A35F|nr:major facilitator superfamily domain-containing protein [Daldinia decipiens]KAI1660554.1 major facilitator superfamily domain-containing protein [Daldinia decipiens]